jgi:hypothetical protein
MVVEPARAGGNPVGEFSLQFFCLYPSYLALHTLPYVIADFDSPPLSLPCVFRIRLGLECGAAGRLCGARVAGRPLLVWFLRGLSVCLSLWRVGVGGSGAGIT